MSDQTLFESNEQPNTVATDIQDPSSAATTSDPYTTLLQGIKTEDGRQKYATTSDALNSIPHKESHIETLESELKVLRDKLAAEEAARKAAESLTVASTPDTPSGNPQTEQTKGGISKEELAELVQAQLANHDIQSTRKQRVKSFRDKLVEQYGEKASEIYATKVKESGLSEQIILNAEVEKPGSAWKFLGLDTVKPEPNDVPTSTSTVNQPNTDTRSPAFQGMNMSAKPGSKYREMAEEKLKELGASWKDIR